MPRPSLHPDVALDIHLSAICSRHRYDTDPTACLDELRATAGRRTDLLAQAAGSWGGFYRDEYTWRLCDALLALDGAAQHAAGGARRASASRHDSRGYVRRA